MTVFESSRKVQVFGSSLAMTLPALFVKANEIKKGSVMKVYYGLDGILVISWAEKEENLNKSLRNILKKLEEKNKDVGN